MGQSFVRPGTLGRIITDHLLIRWNPLTRSELFDNVLGSVYRAKYVSSTTLFYSRVSPTVVTRQYPALSLLFSIFALATLFDFDKPSYYVVEAQGYHILSHVSMNFTSTCTETSVHTVIALVRFFP